MALVVVPACAQVLGGPSIGETWNGWEILFFATSWVGLFLPFAAFAGGLRCSGGLRGWRLGLAASVLSMSSFLLLGNATPYFLFRAEAEVGVDVSQRYPEGPVTINGLKRLRSRALESPPDQYSFSVGRLLEVPPNWLNYRIHTVLVLSLFAILAAFLGAVTAGLTTGLSPPASRNARWAIGLASSVLFFGAEAFGGAWVRADLQNSGILGAWGALALPILELAILNFLLIRSRRGSTDFPFRASDD